MKRVLAIIMAVIILSLSACTQNSGDGGFARGVVENGVYTSEFADLTFAPASGWTFASEEELLGMMYPDYADMTDAERDKLDIGGLKTIYDAKAVGDDRANVLIMLENLAATEGGTDFDEAAYAEVMATGLSALGFECDTTGLAQMTIGNNTYVVFQGTEYAEDYTREQRYHLRRIDDYMLCICITTYPGVTVSYEDVLAMFS